MKRVEMNEKSVELIGILQAISVVAKNLAQRLILLEEEVSRREESLSERFTSKRN